MKFLKFFEDNFWGSEASGILIIASDTNRILVGFRSGSVLEPYTWGNFGGAIGLDDYGRSESKLSPEDNAVKEMSEEIGYYGDIEIIPAYIFEKSNFKYYNYLGLVPTEFNIDDLELNWEVSKVKWVDLNEFLTMDNKHFGLIGLIENNIDLIKKYAK